MDMKKILQAFDGATEKKPVQGANDMKKFLSIIKESSNPYTPAQESVITSFEEGSVGGDANAFLLAADTIQDEVMAQVNKIKINADEASLRDMMDKFNAFMTAYHNVGKGILQPDMFNDSMGESTEEQVDEAGMYRKPGSSSAYDRDYASSVSGMGKRDSIAYQQDGGANDEGWGEEPRSSYQGSAQAKTQMVGMFFYNVQPGQEQEAAALGIKKTKSGKWAKTKYNTSGRTFGFQKDQADKAFGVGKWWAPKTESVEKGVAEGWQEDSQELEDWSKEVNKRLYRAHESQRPALAKQLSKLEQKNFGSSLNQGSLTEIVRSALQALQKGDMVHYDPQSVGQMPFGNIVGDDARVIANSGLSKYDVDGYRGLKKAGIVDTIEQFLHLRDLADNQGQALLKYANMPPVAAWMQFIKDIGWSKDDMNEEVQAKTDDKLLAYYAKRKAEKEKQKQPQGVAEGLSFKDYVALEEAKKGLK